MNKRAYQKAPTPKYIPAYSIVKLDGEYEKQVVRMVPISDKKDRNGNQKFRMEYATVKLPKGYLVETPLTRAGYHRNGTFHVPTLEKLEELGFTDVEVPTVDEDGEPVGSVPLKIKKEKVNA